MHGEGTIGYEKNGKYEYYCLQYYDGNGKKRKKRFPYTKQGERDAKKFQSEMFRKKADGIQISTTYTVASWIDQYIRTYKINTLRESSFNRIMQSYYIIEVSPIANIPLDKLNATITQNFLNMLAEKWTDSAGKEHRPLASSSISKVYKLLKAAYKIAMQDRLISYDPMITVPAVKVRTKEMSVFTWREIGRIFRAIRKIKDNPHNSKQTHDYYLLFRMLLETGCRVGELLALRWEDVNFSKREIFIHSTKGKEGQVFSDPKTASGRRHVPIIFDKLLAMLKEYRSQGKIIRMTGFIFANRNGGAADYRRVLDCWQHVQKLTGITKNVHTFRHTAATYLLEKGIPVAEVSRILGHADATITYGMYVHSIPGYNQKIIDQFRRKDNRKKRKRSEHTQKHTQIN